MRTLTLFALSVMGTAALSGDAMAFGKKRGGNGCNGGGGCSGYVYSGYDHGYSHGCSGGGYGGYSHGCSGGGYTHSGWSGGYHVGSVGVTSDYTVVRGTDGTTYTRGADGSYYSADTISTLGGFTTQPYYSGRVMAGPYPGTYSTYPGTYTYPGMYRGTGYPTGVYPAGYTSGYYDPRVTPAGYTAPLTMPGINIGAGGINIVPGLMPRR